MWSSLTSDARRNKETKKAKNRKQRDKNKWGGGIRGNVLAGGTEKALVLLLASFLLSINSPFVIKTL
jgi:hypothetical protein